MRIKCNFIFSTIFFLTIIKLIICSPTPIDLNQVYKSYLSDNSYSYLKLVIPETASNNTQFLLIEARRNVEQDFLDNVFSDPNLYISETETYPGPNKNTWSGNKFGDEIISINQYYVKPGAQFYIAVYCEFKCNYVLDAKLYNNYEMKEDKMYTITMVPDDVIKATFKSRKKFDELKVNCVSLKMKPFRIFLAKKDPSSSNTIRSNPIFINGYYFLIQKGDDNYKTEQEYEILIENKNYKQDLIFWITYDNEDTEISELSSIFGTASPNTGNCYYFNIDKQYANKNIIISTTLFNGNGYLKMGGWEKVKDMKIKKEDKNTYPIISDKSILLTQENFKSYGEIKNNNKKLYFCFIASEETSYTIRVYYQEHAEKAQRLNYLLPGIGTDDRLPSKTLTKYRLYYLEQDKDFKIELKVKSGSPNMYIYYSYEENDYMDKKRLDGMITNSTIIKSSKINYQKYEIRVDAYENKCLLQPMDNEKECQIFVVIECTTDKDCLYELFFDHIGSIITMKPKVIYSNVITEKEIDKYEIRITDENIKNIAVILSQNTGNTKLKLEKFISMRGDVVFEDSEEFNKNYLPNIIEIRSDVLKTNSLRGIFELEVIGISFSSYNLYYYPFDDDNSNKLDHKTISMPLIKGNIIQDYIKDNHYVKVYSYDNSNVGSKKSDLFIYLDKPSYSEMSLYVFKNLDDYSYENKKIKGSLFQSKYNNFVYISKNDPDYIVGNLYIMVFLKNNEDSSNVIYRKEGKGETPFLLAITDDTTPLTLIEGVEFMQTLTKQRVSQTFYYNHQNRNEDFSLSVSSSNNKIKLGVKIENKDHLYEKIINENYLLKIEKDDINNYCPSSKSCNIEIKIEVVNYYDLDFQVSLLCKSSQDTIVYLNKNGFIDKRKILNKEKQYFVVETIPSVGMDLRINAVFSHGRGHLYGRIIKDKTQIEKSLFPDQDNYDYMSDFLDNEEISLISIPYDEIKNNLPCKILLTVVGEFMYIGKTEGEYTLSVSNVVDDIFVNKNYRLIATKGEIKYYRFVVKGFKTRLSISMTNKEVDGFMYLNYATMNKEMNDFQWKSAGSYNEYIDISIEDPFFVSRKIYSLEGEYYLAVRTLKDTYFNLYISDLNSKIMTISEEFPGTCTCEKEGDYCYFRYENINSPEIAEVIEQELIFYFEFTYGTAEIFASLFENGNNGIIFQYLPNNYRRDYKSSYSNQYLRVKLNPGDKKYTLDSVLVLSTRCKSKSMFDFNVRPLIKSGEIIKDSEGIFYLSMNKDNVFFIQNTNKPIKLSLYSTYNYPIIYEAKALSGSAEVHSYINNEKVEDYDVNIIKGYKHLTQFSVAETDTLSYFDSITKDNSFRQNIFFEVRAIKDCLFSIFFHYSVDPLPLPMSKQVQGKLIDGKLYAYVELRQEYNEVFLNIDKMHSDSQYAVYAKTNIVNSLNFKMTFSYSSPTEYNYDLKATTNSYSPTLCIKINNLPKELFTADKKVITIFYIVAENDKSFNDKINMIVYPNVDHYKRILPQPKKYLYSSLTSKDLDQTVFTLKQQEAKDNLLIIEISTCKGNFGYELTNNLNKKSEIQDLLIGDKGKKLIVSQIEKNAEYYLSIYGLKEDEMIIGPKIGSSSDVDFLLYYYTTEENLFSFTDFDSTLTYIIKAPGNIILNVPVLEIVKDKKKLNKIEDLKMTVVISDNKYDFNYMGSICYLSKQVDIIESKKLYENYTINVNMNDNEIEVKNLDKNKNYYINVLVTNIKTGQLFTFDPVQLIPNKRISNNILIILLSIGIVVLIFVIFYFYRKYRIAKAIVNYESNDIKNMGTIPKSITELKKIQEEKNKQSKDKYNSLTEDSG